MATIRSQPPGDEGSRKRLLNRKGKIDNVEHAYSGIVNVYALRPSGSGAISLGEFTGGKLVIPPDAVLHKQPALSLKDRKTLAIAQSKVGDITYGFDNTRPAPGLYRKINGKFIEGEGPVDAITYEQEMTRRGSNLSAHYSDEDEKYKKALGIAQFHIKKALDHGKFAYDKKVREYAMRFRLPISTMDQIVREYWVAHSGVMNPQKAFDQIEKISKVQMKEQMDSYLMQLIDEPSENTPTAKFIISELTSPKFGMSIEDIRKEEGKIRPPMITETSETSGPVEIREVKAYPIPIDNLRELKIVGPEYAKISGDHLASVAANNPSSLSFKREPNNGISYYVKVLERKKQKRNVNIKRVIYRLKKPSLIKKSVKKSPEKKCVKSKSAKIKQNILNKFKCVCRRKKK